MISYCLLNLELILIIYKKHYVYLVYQTMSGVEGYTKRLRTSRSPSSLSSPNSDIS